MPADQFIIFFMLLLTGYFCKKYKVFTDLAINGINKFIIYIAYPSLILTKTAALEMESRIFVNFLMVIIISIGFFLLIGAYARLYCHGKRFEGEDRPALELAVLYPNNGFMGFPVAITFFGNFGLLYMVANNVAMNISMFTYGVTVLKRGRGSPGELFLKKTLKFLKMIANPNISAAIAGIIFCYNHVELPGIAGGFLDLVSAAATPLAMISIGTMLAGSMGLSTFKKRAVIEPIVNRLFVIPLIAAAIVWFLPLDSLVKTILVVANVLPTAAYVPILCEQYGRDKSLASEIVVVSTLFSMATIPFAIWLLGRAVLM